MLQLENRVIHRRRVWAGWLNHNLCRDRTGRGLCLVRSGSGGGWVGSVSASQPRPDRDNRGRVNRPINYWVSRGHELLIALSLFRLSSSLTPQPFLSLPDLVARSSSDIPALVCWVHLSGVIRCVLLLSHDITYVQSTPLHIQQHAKISSLCPTLSTAVTVVISEHRKLWLFCQRSVSSRQCRQVGQVSSGGCLGITTTVWAPLANIVGNLYYLHSELLTFRLEINK